MREGNREKERLRERDRDRVREAGEQVSWCFTPSQPVRLYQGGGRERERERD